MTRLIAMLTVWGLSLLTAFSSAVAADQAGASPGQPAAWPTQWQTGLQGIATPVESDVHDFYNLVNTIIIGVTVFVFALLVVVVIRFRAKANPVPTKTSHNTLLEVAWTLIPVLILVVIAIPSFKLMYFMNATKNVEMTVKVVGHQWYWEYQYPDEGGFSITSNLDTPTDPAEMAKKNAALRAQGKPEQLRLLDVDNRLVLPVGTNIRFLISSADVIHSFFVPSFGIQKNATPGHTRETWARVDKEGVYYGQCNFICGLNHSQMPIAIEVVSKEKYKAWVEQAKKNAAAEPDAAPAQHATNAGSGDVTLAAAH